MSVSASVSSASMRACGIPLARLAIAVAGLVLLPSMALAADPLAQLGGAPAAAPAVPLGEFLFLSAFLNI